MNSRPITVIGGRLSVPDFPVIPYVEGDGIGAEICPPTLQAIDAAVRKSYGERRRIAWKELLAGDKAKQQAGEWLPPQTLEDFNRLVVGLKGPLMTPVGEGKRSLNVALRQALDLYACVRPVRWFKGVASPVKQPELVDLVIFRENTEDLYAGIEFELGDERNRRFERFLIDEMQVESIRFPGQSAYGVKPVSRPGSERLIRAALRYAINTQASSLTLVHKGNIMKFTEGAFRNWGYQLVRKEFEKYAYDGRKGAAGEQTAGKVCVRDMIADAFFQDLLLNPGRHAVVATLNLNGDYISDMAAAMVGGIGIAPGANINYETGRAIFEATHGTAPDIAGTDRANPSSLMLSGAMLLEYLGWEEAGRRLRNAIGSLFERRIATFDISEKMEAALGVGTAEFAALVMEEIESGNKPEQGGGK